jgi:hypothetical protein
MDDNVTFNGIPVTRLAGLNGHISYLNSEFRECGAPTLESIIPPRTEIGTTHGVDNKSTGFFSFDWPEGYLESIPDGVVELASTESSGVRYRFCVERVKE